jgi:hypothetical protein
MDPKLEKLILADWKKANINVAEFYRIVDFFDSVSDSERESMFQILHGKWCRNCGRKIPPTCNCTRDE